MTTFRKIAIAVILSAVILGSAPFYLIAQNTIEPEQGESAQEPIQPAQEPDGPAQDVTEPLQDAVESVPEAVEPAQDAAGSVQETVEPPQEVVEPAQDAVESAQQAIESAFDFMDEPEDEDMFQWPLPDEAGIPESPEAEEDIMESSFSEQAPPSSSPRTRDMVVVPERHTRKFFDAGDFRDPFFPVRGFQSDSPKSLEPGVTIDGLRFNAYGDTNQFIQRFYQNSGFSPDDVFGKVVRMERRRGCLFCHRGIEEINENHRFSCTKCHGGNRKTRSISKAHKGMVANPSDLKHAGKYCGKCHAEQVEKVQRSAMATNKGIINITRYAWGAQSHDSHQYSLLPVKDKEKALPEADQGHAVDGFLRTKCLRCHLQGNAPHRSGDYRATGCAACHMVYANSGLTMTHDRAIQWTQKKNNEDVKDRFRQKTASQSLKNPRGYPVLHKFTLAIPSVQCEHCHNANGVGNEFEGMFAKPARPQASFQTTDADKPVLHGSEHEFLVPDIHRERGMHCIDCHGSGDLKGPAPSPALHSGVEIRCEDCHGTESQSPGEFLILETDPNAEAILKTNFLNPNLKKKVRPGDTILVNSKGTPMPHIKKLKNQWVLYSKVTGKKHEIPILKEMEAPVAHQVEGHMKALECHACHARWSASDWGLHLIREKTADLEKWKDWNFPDPSLQQLLSTKPSDPDSPESAPGMLDWLTAQSTPQGIKGKSIEGVWWDVFTESSWSSMILGKNDRGKYSILKPRYQYFLTDLTGESSKRNRAKIIRTKDGKPALMMIPHTPHSIRKKVRRCESCHESTTAVGLGDPTRFSVQDAKRFTRELKNKNRVVPEFQLKQVIVESGEPLQTIYPPGKARFLNKKEIEALDQKTESYQAYRYLDLRELSFSRLLIREEFPYDSAHRSKENQFGSPEPTQDWFYDLNRSRFVSSKEVPAELLPPTPPQFPVTSKQPERGGMTEDGSRILEYSLDLFRKKSSSKN